MRSHSAEIRDTTKCILQDQSAEERELCAGESQHCSQSGAVPRQWGGAFELMKKMPIYQVQIVYQY